MPVNCKKLKKRNHWEDGSVEYGLSIYPYCLPGIPFQTLCCLCFDTLNMTTKGLFTIRLLRQAQYDRHSLFHRCNINHKTILHIAL